jgi:DNA-binding NtrC family response regulator
MELNMPKNRNKSNGFNDILILDDEMPNLKLLSELLGREGYQVRLANDPQMAIDSARAQPPKLILLDVRLPQIDGFEVCERLKQDEQTRDIPIIFISALQDVQDRVRGFEVGGVDFISKPFQDSEILARVRTHLELRSMQLHLEELVEKRTAEVVKLKNQIEQENIYLLQEIEIKHKHEEIIGNSEPVRNMLSSVEQVAHTESTVLILGETGTGKELLARAIHDLSPRKDRQMVTLNCAALPATLLESELFGREKGAYTGAMTRQIGRFEIADGSTLFLDEIGEMSLEVQAKLLRVLQEGQFERLGNPETISVNVRIIASTNRDLARAVAEGSFREDLYYRLNVFSITVPPLRERIEDIPLLVWAFIKEFEKPMGKAIEKFNKKV